ncbi:Transcriptional regulator, contains XRE-family HTH domain [Thermoactinomyces sp. DSM 45891]|uniref:helix-turn-helix domain-containing protein n=1 Tax=Thermoactinomyces sp. DSM 45891 TaxID=1761907 RepID=UPI000910F6C4|nr:helix-turn-helix transcriptional regulator [Thermoactinomyces sp. DSM 45891]SFX65925.1 Transcriptional regulator, contains XRE-family HTH domain [Thermoactinomyces sp. DSM 45891]
MENLLGKRLKEARLNADMLQREVAEKIGIGHAAISQYEKGNRNPDPETLSKIANLYGVSVDWLLDRPSDQVSQNEEKLSVVDLEKIVEMINDGKAHYGGRRLTKEDSRFITDFIQFAIQRKKHDEEND